MAGFHLGGGGHTTRSDTSPVPTESIFLYARSTSRTGGFQLWPPNPSQHPQFFSPGGASSSPATVLSFSHEPPLGANASGARSGTSCQDCGNNAKKDCIHLRCRTCCRSRGFLCSTHVKSTWVPAAKRRERQHQLAALMASGTSGGSSEGTKRARDQTGMRSITRVPTVVATTSSSGDGGRFPAEVSSEAVFRCVKIGPLDEADDDELAYQTAVSIGGHIFKGILRNHGPETVDYNQLHGGDPASSPSVAAATSSEAGVGVGGSHAATSAAQVLMDSYPTPLGAFMQGTPFFPHQPRN
ncbi:SHI-related sequence 7 [Rhynchospora pubera]|uniref:SHI-related sequence 7 n=1 Tax=Rhynchospora pubera TaxID=906938 RepID=A0AAV8E6U9_9POAL|nr:SHI-related sequence 7 [Rhynchospora pubera]